MSSGIIYHEGDKPVTEWEQRIAELEAQLMQYQGVVGAARELNGEIGNWLTLDNFPEEVILKAGKLAAKLSNLDSGNKEV